MASETGRLQVLLLHGPNLNLTGFRQPEVYGKRTLEEIDEDIKAAAERLNIDIRIMQSNHEGVLIDTIQEHRRWADAIVINPAGLGHTSVSLRDALSSIRIPIIEVHLSNIHAREEFRRHTLVSEIAVGQICGFGGNGYVLALEAVATLDRENV